MTLREAMQASYLRRLFWVTFAAHAAVGVLVYAASFLPTFDSSASALIPIGTSRIIASLLRWDSFHFGANALSSGYAYEHQWAFLPGISTVMSIGSRIMKSSAKFDEIWPGVLAAGALGSLACGVLATRTLYMLSLHHLRSHQLALLTALLSLIPASPATLLFAPYTEAYFAYLSYEGMLACSRRRYGAASLFFAFATAFRSNGVMLAGYILYDLLAEPALLQRRVPPFASALQATVLSLVIASPFVWHQYRGYQTFCVVDSTSPWCNDTMPSVYGYVQSTYWNVGFMRYWTSAQIPNILLATPLLALLLTASIAHIRHVFIPRLFHAKNEFKSYSPFDTATLIPYAVHTAILSLILLFASHTQIALRLASSLPMTYWAAARLLVERPALGRLWVVWSIIWGAVSIILWTTFLPPA